MMNLALLGGIGSRGKRVAPAPAGGGPRTYSTNFDATENPISEGGVWNHLGTDWQNVRTSGGLAFTPAQQDSYDDAYAYLSGFTNDHQAEATIRLAGGYSAPSSHETEILLRVSDTSSTFRAYECNLAWNGGYAQIMHLDGVIGSFDEVPAYIVNNPIAPQDGDILRARIVGSLITAWLVRAGTPTIIAQANDSRITTGQPGMAFFMRAGGTPSSYCFTSFSATDI